VTSYDDFAEAYDAHNATSPWNARYERPAVLGLVGEVAGLRILDAGCGGGAHAAELVRRGAEVVGLDASASLLAIARDRLGADVQLHHGDLADPLPFEDGSFDVVLASLVLHYLERWEPTLGELARVLRPGGRIVASTHHPFMDHAASGAEDYFATYGITEQWTMGHVVADVSFWHRPLRAMLDSFAAAGLDVVTIAEPQPDPALEADDPEAFRTLSTSPQFLLFELRPTGR
jgi:ubiquinone/menaquinone biosynthesis C-methylase UbiE